MKIDALSGWATAPPAARLAGDEVYRWFDTPEEAMCFIASPAGDADRQHRLRLLARERKRKQRARDRVGVSYYVVALDAVLVEDALVSSGVLPEARADDRELAASIFSGLLTKWLERRRVTRDNAPSKPV